MSGNAVGTAKFVATVATDVVMIIVGLSICFSALPAEIPLLSRLPPFAGGLIAVLFATGLVVSILARRRLLRAGAKTP